MRHLPSLRTGLAAAAMLAAAMPTAAAHPHVWVDTRSELVFDEAGSIVAVRHRWTFDEFFSSYATMGLDEDGDGVLTREELQPLAQVNVESLHEYDYFTFLDAGDGYERFADPVDYWLEMQADERLTLHFTLPLAEAQALGENGRASIEVYDPTFFVDFALAETETASLVGAPAGCELDIERAEPFDEATAMRLAEIPADIRELPPELFALTEGNANVIRVSCP